MAEARMILDSKDISDAFPNNRVSSLASPHQLCYLMFNEVQKKQNKSFKMRILMMLFFELHKWKRTLYVNYVQFIIVVAAKLSHDGFDHSSLAMASLFFKMFVLIFSMFKLQVAVASTPLVHMTLTSVVVVVLCYCCC
jgi:hypothetical protein